MVEKCLRVKGAQVQILPSRHRRPDTANKGGVRAIGRRPSVFQQRRCIAELIDWVSLDHASPIGSSFSILRGVAKWSHGCSASASQTRRYSFVTDGTSTLDGQSSKGGREGQPAGTSDLPPHGLPARSHRKRPEIALVALGAVADLVGADPAEVAPAAIEQVMRAVPRLRMKEDFKRFLSRCSSSAPQDLHG
jgi:hypothetical protein